MRLCDENFIFFLDQSELNSKKSILLNKRRINITKLCTRMLYEKYETTDARIRAKGEDQLIKIDGFKPDR